MKKRVCLAVTLLVFGAAWAEAPLKSSLEQYVVEVSDTGEEVFRVADEEEPGTTIEYRLTLTHVGECQKEDIRDCALAGVMPTVPVPEGTYYVADSATAAPARLEVSIDHGSSWETEPVTRMVVGEDGKEEEVVVPPSQYTNLRWSTAGPLLPEEERRYRYRVRVK